MMKKLKQRFHRTHVTALNRSYIWRVGGRSEMKEAVASNVEGRGLARSDAIDHERGKLERKRESSNFFLWDDKIWVLKKNMVHVCYGVCFRMERTVRRDSGDEFS